MPRLNLNTHMPRWHRFLGISGALFALLLAGTGILLNHTSDLKLDNRYVQSDWFLKQYGLHVPEPLSYPVGSHWISQLGQRLYLDKKEIASDTSPLTGALTYVGMTVITTENSLWLLDETGALIEQLKSHDSLPGNPIDLGITKKNELALKTSDGWYTTNEALYPWRPMSGSPIESATTGSLPSALQQTLKHSYLGKGLSQERLLLDLHTGRIFGPLGVYLVDLMALILCGLAITGLTTWFKRRRNSSQLRPSTERLKLRESIK